MSKSRSRKDTRAVVPLTARYRSPTTFEYVEEECYDVSVGGMFICSRAPAPAGTLIKLECEARSDAGKIRGVARVVWLRRDADDSGPAGMGVKFVKLDPGSRDLIRSLVAQVSDPERAHIRASLPPRPRSTEPPPAPQPGDTMSAATPPPAAAPAAAAPTPVPTADVARPAEPSISAQVIGPEAMPQIFGAEAASAEPARDGSVTADVLDPIAYPGYDPARPSSTLRMGEGERPAQILEGDTTPPGAREPSKTLRSWGWVAAFTAAFLAIVFSDWFDGSHDSSSKEPLQIDSSGATEAEPAPTPHVPSPEPTAAPNPASTPVLAAPAVLVPPLDAPAAATSSAAARAAPASAAAHAATLPPSAASRSVEPKRAHRLKGSPLEIANACLAQGDNECVVQVLTGKAKTPREYELLIETLRATGRTADAQPQIASYLRRFPTATRAASYRRLLESKPTSKEAAEPAVAAAEPSPIAPTPAAVEPTAAEPSPAQPTAAAGEARAAEPTAAAPEARAAQPTAAAPEARAAQPAPEPTPAP